MAKTDYTNPSQQNLMKIVGWLATDVTRTATIKEICDGLDLTAAKVNWTLHNLRERGWVEQTGGGWRLSSGLAQIAERVRKGMAASVERYLGGAA